MKKTIVLSLLLSLQFTLLYAQEFGTGLLLDKKLYENTLRPAILTRGDFFNLPDYVSLKEYCPDPKSQGKYSTCAGWACAFYTRTILEAIKYGWSKDEINRNVFSPSYVYNYIRGINKCAYGVSLVDALDVIKNSGAPKLSDFEYSCEKSVSDKDKEIAANYKVQDYRMIAESGDKNKFMKVKKSLSEQKPVIIAFSCPPSFYFAKDVWNPPYEDYSNNHGGHALTVIGYDDTAYGGAFEIINSWGPKWGNKGYTFIRYKDFEYFTQFAFEVIDSIKTRVNNKLSGVLKFIESNGAKMKTRYNNEIFRMVKKYKTDTKFELLLSNDQPAYVYAFSSDEKNDVYTIFPQKVTINPLLPYKKNNVAIPDEDSYNMLDDFKGKSYYCFLYSKEALDFSKLLNEVKTAKGTFREKVNSTLGNKIIVKDINYFDGEEIKFEGTADDKTVVAVVVEFDHE